MNTHVHTHSQRDEKMKKRLTLFFLSFIHRIDLFLDAARESLFLPFRLSTGLALRSFQSRLSCVPRRLVPRPVML